MHFTTSDKAITLNINPRPVFNGLVKTNNLSSFGNGTYRIYADFREPYGNVLNITGGIKIEATYEFTITFD